MVSGVTCQVRLPRLLKPDSVSARFCGVQVVGVSLDWAAARRRRASLEAAETGEHAAGRGVVELEVARADREGQHLRNQVEVDRGEEGGLLGLAHRVLIEGGVIALHPRIHDGRAGERADVREAAGRCPGPLCRRTRRNVLVVPAGLVVQLVVFPEGADDRPQPPLIRRAQAEFVLLVGVALDRSARWRSARSRWR